MKSIIQKSLTYFLLAAALLALDYSASATIHIIRIRDASSQFIPQYEGPILVGDTIQWLPLGTPIMAHTITSTSIPENAASFDGQWFLPADTFFQYVPTEAGLYNYVCLPHQSSGMVGSFEVEEALGIDDYLTGEPAIRIFPNPAFDWLIIDERYPMKRYEIYTIAGTKVQSGDQPSNRIPIDELPRGMYMIELNGNPEHTMKFVKN